MTTPAWLSGYQTGVPTFVERAPGAAERRLQELSAVTVKAADLGAAAGHGEGTVTKRTSDPFGAADLVYQPLRSKGAWIEIPFEIKAKEPLHLVLDGTRSEDGGRYQASLEGVKVGWLVDFGSDSPGEQEFQLLDFWPESGTYTLRLDCVGKAPRSGGFACTVRSVRLLERRPRVATFGHDKDWGTDPTLYR